MQWIGVPKKRGDHHRYHSKKTRAVNRQRKRRKKPPVTPRGKTKEQKQAERGEKQRKAAEEESTWWKGLQSSGTVITIEQVSCHSWWARERREGEWKGAGEEKAWTRKKGERSS